MQNSASDAGQHLSGLKRYFPLLTGLIAIIAVILAFAGVNVMPQFVVNRYDDTYANGSQVLCLQLIIVCGCFWLYLAALRFDRVRDGISHSIGAATPGTLGAIRMLVCVILLLSALWEDLPSTSYLPHDMRLPYGVIKILHTLPIGFDRFLESHTLLAAWQWITIAALFLGAIGLWTRWVLPVGAVGYLVLGGILREYSHFFHTGVAPLYLLMALVFMPCHHGWSLDRLIAIARGRSVMDANEPRPVYAWSRYILWVLVAIPYLLAGLSKLRESGWMWPAPENMKAIFFSGSLVPMHFDFELSLMMRDAPEAFFLLLGIGALSGELLYCLTLFSKLARMVCPLAMLFMHLGIFFFQNILFFDLILIQAVFFDFRKLRKWVAARIRSRRGSLKLLYDSRSFASHPAHRSSRTVALLRSIDIFERLDFIDFRQIDLNEFNQTHNTSIQSSQLEAEMHLLENGRVRRGYDLYRVLALSFPATWPIAPLVFSPGAQRIVEFIHARVSKRRLESARDDEASTLPSFPLPPFQHIEEQQTWIGLSAVAFAAFLLFGTWAIGAEFYPLTSMGMFKERSTSGEVEYFKPVVHYDSGDSEEARFDQWIGSMADARYRRIVGMVFSDNRDLSFRFFDACIERANAQGDSGRRVVGFEIQKWSWDFRNQPNHPTFGDLEETVHYPAQGKSQVLRN